MFSIEASEISVVQDALQKLPHRVFRTEVALNALKKAAVPMQTVMNTLTPIGTRKYIPPKKSGDMTYARGGQLVRSLRIKATNYPKYGQVQVLVGYSKLPGKAGWRAHFTEHGYTSRSGRKIPGQKFMKRAENATINLVEAIFNLEIQRHVDLIVDKL